ncbi:hypothetical protein B0H34DRAFT_394022 [Crassisporium funariophilum]|nr:hypothetical protein B0H34DRAFT_394022 [Crassisporium funariophilum]
MKNEFLCRTIFPYAQAKVCTHWRNVLSLEPTFWTRIIVSRIANEYTPPKLLQQYLQWTRNLVIDVYVGNIRNEHIYPDEGTLIERYTEILLPHIHRCRTIDYEVRYSTTLPALSRLLPTISWNLIYLRLKSEETYDEHRIGQKQPPGTEGPRLWVMPVEEDIALHELILDGRNFILACQIRPDLVKNVLGKITINNYRPQLFVNKNEPTFTTRDALRVLEANENASHLRLENLEFTRLPADTVLANLNHMPNLQLANVGYGFMNQLFHEASWGHHATITFEACTFNESTPIPHCSSAILRRVEEAEIRYFLTQWIGTELAFEDCPGLIDQDILMHAELNPTLRCLMIDDCERITLGALRLLVEGLTMDTLSIGGAKDTMTQEAAGYFQNNLHRFEWRPAVPSAAADKTCLADSPAIDFPDSSILLNESLEGSFELEALVNPELVDPSLSIARGLIVDWPSEPKAGLDQILGTEFVQKEGGDWAISSMEHEEAPGPLEEDMILEEDDLVNLDDFLNFA